jgi:hypothetical protein
MSERKSKKKSEENLDYGKTTQPDAPTLFSNQNKLKEALDALEIFEKFTNTDRTYQNSGIDNNDTGDRHVKDEDGKPYDGVLGEPIKAKKVASAESSKDAIHEEDVKNISDDMKVLDEVLRDYKAFERYIGVANDDLVGFDDEVIDTKKFPMDSNKPKIAGLKQKAVMDTPPAIIAPNPGHKQPTLPGNVKVTTENPITNFVKKLINPANTSVSEEDLAHLERLQNAHYDREIGRASAINNFDPNGLIREEQARRLGK